MRPDARSHDSRFFGPKNKGKISPFFFWVTETLFFARLRRGTQLLAAGTGVRHPSAFFSNTRSGFPPPGFVGGWQLWWGAHRCPAVRGGGPATTAE